MRAGAPILRQHPRKTITATQSTPYQLYFGFDGSSSEKTFYLNDGKSRDIDSTSVKFSVSITGSIDELKIDFSLLSQSEKFKPNPVEKIVIFTTEKSTPERFYLRRRNSIDEDIAMKDMDLTVTTEILENNGAETGQIVTIKIPQGENVILSESFIKAYPKTYDSLIDCSSKADECPEACEKIDNQDAPDFVPRCVYRMSSEGEHIQNYEPSGFRKSSRQSSEISTELSLKADYKKFYYEPIRKVCVRAEALSTDVVRIKYYDCEKERYEVRVTIFWEP